MMNREARLIVIVPHYEYFQKERNNYDTDLVYYKESCVVTINKNNKSLSQILRTKDSYTNIATNLGFKIIKEKQLAVDTQLSKDSSKHESLYGETILTMLVYER